MLDFQMDWHVTNDYPEWGSAPRHPLVRFDMAHQGELMDSIIGPHPETGKPTVYHIIRCELCICTHVWPLPSQQALATYYREQFYQTDKVDMVARYERDRLWWEKCVHEPILRHCRMSDVLDSPEENVVRFLDIGAGPGIALDVAKNVLGWESYGIEPNGALCDDLISRGHRMHCGVLDTHDTRLCFRSQMKEPKPASDNIWRGALPPSSPFHCLYAYEVLEHQSNPEEFLLSCYDMLASRGYLVVVVPNDYNPLQLAAQKALGIAPWWLAPPQHLQYFTPKTLQLVVRRCGFKIIEMRGTYAMEKFLLRGKNYIGNDALGRECHQQRMQEELFILQSGLWGAHELQRRYDLAERREGREIICIAQKM